MFDVVRSLIDRVRGARAMRRVRLERFGAIIQLALPRALVFVDRAMARRVARVPDAPAAWRAAESELGAHVLSAPLEAHLQLTNKCAAGCTGCYTGASARGAPNEWGLAEWTRAIDHLADAGVFHLALGGGESATLPWLGELAAHARARGLVPNLTTSGLDGLDALLAIADRFGHCARSSARSASTSSSRGAISTSSTRCSRTHPSAGCRRSSCCASNRRGAARARTTSCAAPTRNIARSCRRSWRRRSGIACA